MVAFFAAVFHCVVGSNHGSPGKEALHVLECDGRLEFKRLAMLKGGFPRDFELMPGEKFMPER